jgi:hypothetical protein
VRGFISAVMLEAKEIGARIGIPIDEQPEDRHQVTRKLGAMQGRRCCRTWRPASRWSSTRWSSAVRELGAAHAGADAVHRCAAGPGAAACARARPVPRRMSPPARALSTAAFRHAAADRADDGRQPCGGAPGLQPRRGRGHGRDVPQRCHGAGGGALVLAIRRAAGAERRATGARCRHRRADRRCRACACIHPWRGCRWRWRCWPSTPTRCGRRCGRAWSTAPAGARTAAPCR